MARTAGSGRSSLRHLPEELTGLHCAGRLRPDRLREQYAKLSGEPKVPNASLRHSRRQEVRSRQRMRSKLWTKRSGQGPPRESERCSPAATTKMHPTDWIGSKHS